MIPAVPKSSVRRTVPSALACLLTAASILTAMPPAFGQAAPVTTTSSPVVETNSPVEVTTRDTRPVTRPSAKAISKADRKTAAKAFSEGKKALHAGEFDVAEREFAEAVRLDPNNPEYVMEHELLRARIVSQLVAEAQAARADGDNKGASAAIARAQLLDGNNPLVQEQIAAQAAASENAVMPASENLPRIQSGIVDLAPTAARQSFHFRGSAQELIREVFTRFGIAPSMDATVPRRNVRMEVDDLTFPEAVTMAMMLSGSFYVPLDPHRVLVAEDTKTNRTKFERQFEETVYLPGLTQPEMQDCSNIARQILGVTQVTASNSTNKLTMRAPEHVLDAVNRVLTDLFLGHSQVMLSLNIYQIARTHTTDEGVVAPSQFTMFNVGSEEAAILSENSALIQQLIASGVVSAGDTLGIIALLIASGAVTGSQFSQGFALFGGGLTTSGVSWGTTTANASLTASDTRELDKIQLRVADQQTGTFREGIRYPIITESYSSVSTNPYAGANIPQITATSNSATSYAATPNIQYQDVGLTFKATPRILRDGDISMALEMTISSLGSGSLNNIPVINNIEYKGSVSLKEGEASVIAGAVSRQEIKALTGIPGLNDIPGFPDTNKSFEVDSSQLVMVLTPHVVRLEHAGGVGKMVLLPAALNHP
jgi:general secretion pathway protein D